MRFFLLSILLLASVSSFAEQKLSLEEEKLEESLVITEENPTKKFSNIVKATRELLKPTLPEELPPTTASSL